MDEIEQRLRETTDACIKSFEAWAKNGKSTETRESLMEGMHEVRKVLARVEIEIAISERDRLGSRPLPIPPHRSSRKGPGEEGDFSEDDFAMDAPQPRQSGGGRPQQGGRGRRPNGPRNNNNNDNRGNSNGNTGGDAQPQ